MEFLEINLQFYGGMVKQVLQLQRIYFERKFQLTTLFSNKI